MLEMIAGEASFRPIRGTVLTLGRQTIYATPAEARQLFSRYGIEPAIDNPQLDVFTKQTRSDKQVRISDTDFFLMLGAEKVVAIDVSDYEGASIIHNLNSPIPDELEGIADFIVDGSTLDNIFDPPCALRNVGRLLKPGGRCIMENRSNAGGPGIGYMMFSAPWFFDYFVANDFKYCQAFSTIHANGKRLVYMMSPSAAMREWGNGRIHSPLTTYTVNAPVFAEKGDNSTWANIPNQQSYRSDEEWALFIPRIAAFLDDSRGPLLRGDDGPDPDSESLRYGWERILPDGTRVRPASGVKWLPDGTMVRP
jgi:hypothetical protein